ncbi:MAG: hypothetical protein VYA34_16065 [Myxococcota bacterium]|nr:hypothetical protein [Myxococcota bacterium]
MKLQIQGKGTIWVSMLALLCVGFISTASAQTATEVDEGLEGVLVLMPESETSRSAFDGLSEELGDEFNVSSQIVDAETTKVEQLAKYISDAKPVVVVLMNNATVSLYRRYQSLTPGPYPAAVMMLTSFLKESSKGIKNATGIIYEIAGITSFVTLRQLLDQPVANVGVVYRPWAKGFVAEQKVLAATEEINIIGTEISGEGNVARQIKRAAYDLLTEEKVDAIWILNDNALLKKEVIANGWLPALKRSSAPVVVNVSSLVTPKIKFGSFAVLPDHEQLGVQAANIIFELQDQDWGVEGRSLEDPLAVEKVLLVDYAQDNFKLKKQALDQVDKLVR